MPLADRMCVYLKALCALPSRFRNAFPLVDMALYALPLGQAPRNCTPVSDAVPYTSLSGTAALLLPCQGPGHLLCHLLRCTMFHVGPPCDVYSGTANDSQQHFQQHSVLVRAALAWAGLALAPTCCDVICPIPLSSLISSYS